MDFNLDLNQDANTSNLVRKRVSGVSNGAALPVVVHPLTFIALCFHQLI